MKNRNATRRDDNRRANSIAIIVAPIVVAMMLSATVAHAAVTGTTNGDFETQALADGSFTGVVTDWFESDATASDFDDWIYRSSSSFVDGNNKGALSSVNGYLYQEVGTFSANETVTVAGVAHDRAGQNFRDFTVSLYSGNVTPAEGSSLTTLGATFLASQTFTAVGLGLTSGAADSSPFSATLNTGVAGIDGSTLWLEITPGAGTSNETFLDNITASASAAIPAPAALPAGLALISLVAARRRRRA